MDGSTPMIPILLANLRALAAVRPPGYLDDVLSRGTVNGDIVWLSQADYEAIRLKYSPRGLGDKIARIAKPIARAIDATFGTSVEQCGACQQRQAWLNTKFPT